MQLSEFYSQVSGAIRRGSSLDAVIPTYARMAARKIERNYTYKHMERFSAYTVDPDASDPRAIALPTRRIKVIHHTRIIGDDGTIYPLKQIDPQELLSIPTEMPRAYWLDGLNYIYLNSTPDKAYTIEFRWDEYTDWPLDLTAEPVLLDLMEDLMMGETMLMIAANMRDQRLQGLWNPIRQEAYTTSIEADLELRQGDRRYVMQYGQPFLRGNENVD